MERTLGIILFVYTFGENKQMLEEIQTRVRGKSGNVSYEKWKKSSRKLFSISAESKVSKGHLETILGRGAVCSNSILCTYNKSRV